MTAQEPDLQQLERAGLLAEPDDSYLDVQVVVEDGVVTLPVVVEGWLDDTEESALRLVQPVVRRLHFVYSGEVLQRVPDLVESGRALEIVLAAPADELPPVPAKALAGWAQECADRGIALRVVALPPGGLLPVD